MDLLQALLCHEEKLDTNIVLKQYSQKLGSFCLRSLGSAMFLRTRQNCVLM